MKTLITPVQCLALAFGGDYLPPETVCEADISATEHRHLVPVIGRALYEKLLAGDYATLRTDYLAAPLALFTRAAIQPRLDIRTGACGTSSPRGEENQTASDEALRRLQHRLQSEAQSLLHRASDYLGAHAELFAEYDADADILNRCTTRGGFVQIR